MNSFPQPVLGSSLRRLLAGIGANAVGKVWVALMQLALIPILATAWGADRFGVWLMVSTVPTYIALSANGFNTAAGTDIMRSHSAGQTAQSRTTYQSIWALITGLSGLAAFAALSLRMTFAFAGKPEWALGRWEAGDAMALMAIYAFIVIQSGTVLALYRGAGRYAQGTLLYDLIGLAESVVIIGAVALDGGLVSAAGAMIAIRTVGHFVLSLWIARKEPWARFGTDSIRRSEMLRLLHPSLGSLSIAAANALSIQGVVVSLGIVAGPAVAAAYASARTIARLPLQVSDLVGRAALPEMARAWFGGDQRTFKRLVTLSVAFALFVLLPFCASQILFGQRLANFVSNGHIAYETWLPAALGIVVLMQGTSVALGQAVTAQNRQHEYGHSYLALAGLMIATPFAFANGEVPATETVLALAVLELLALFLIIRVISKSPRAPNEERMEIIA